MELQNALIEMSRRYGGDEQYVLGGGGNTSCKRDGVMYVKASGTQLGTIGAEGFVKMSVPRLMEMLAKRYPEDDAEREAAALADMNAARLPGEESKRPSVECLLHALYPYTFVLHLHPALVNGMTCGAGGSAVCAELFGGEAVWVPLTKPGYVLGKTCYDAFTAYEKRTGFAPKLLFMQNHGVIAAADTVAEIDALMKRVMDKLEEKVTRRPLMAPQRPAEGAAALAPALRMLYQKRVGSANGVFCVNDELLRLAQSPQAMQPVMLPFSPDHIVYCKGAPLYLDEGQDVSAAFGAYCDEHGYPPKAVVAKGLGLFALGASAKEANLAAQLFLDAVKIAVYAESFGGPLALTPEFTSFILNWEAESYRQKVSLGGGGNSRMAGKICVVTGAAQGFGEGIARAIAAQGGYVAVADMNGAGAQRLADDLCAQYGPWRAAAITANVADEASVKEMVDAAVLTFGGLDVMVSCAGILTAGGLDEMTKENFERVTSVNYTGYFLCAKYASVPMRIQRRYAPGATADIIEINSKSGLEGSKRNFAYAGSKFGGVGLTQSFALELAEYGVKVNAVCPGNLLDGPLWSDPERGLFRQYLQTGKVPGAKTVEDVRRFYEAKVPLGRGCTVEDVAKAVFYLVEQQYETGQALPVTGGQVMLS